MDKTRRTRKSIEALIAAAFAAALGGCGGGGGGGDDVTPPVEDLAITLANRDTVSHAVAAGLLALSPTDAIPLAAGQAAGSARPAALLHRVVAQALASSRAHALAACDQRHALTASEPFEQACAVSGTVTVTVDDADDSQSLSPGDVYSMVYNDCRDTPQETLGGSVTTTFTELGEGSLSARMVFVQYTDTAEHHALTLDGAVRLDFSQPSATTERSRMTAEGPVVAAITTHLPFADTLTLMDGFYEESIYDASVPPPPGGMQAGWTINTLGGSLHSAAAGGTVAVSSLESAPLTKYNAEAYPRSGSVRVMGKAGSLRLTALSAESVQIDLDANDDGAAESSTTVAWEWLL